MAQTRRDSRLDWLKEKEVDVGGAVDERSFLTCMT